MLSDIGQLPKDRFHFYGVIPGVVKIRDRSRVAEAQTQRKGEMTGVSVCDGDRVSVVQERRAVGGGPCCLHNGETIDAAEPCTSQWLRWHCYIYLPQFKRNFKK